MRLALACLLTALALWAQTTLGPTVGLLVPVWDSLNRHYVYLTLAEFRPLVFTSGGVAYTLPLTPPEAGDTLQLPTTDEQILVCKVPSLQTGTPTSACRWTGQQPTGIGLTIGGALPGGQVGVPYSASLIIQGGEGPYLWEVTEGTLPPGLELRDNGVLMGTPTKGGLYNVTVRVTDNVGESAFATFVGAPWDAALLARK